MTSRVDQCNAVLAGDTKSVTNTLQRVMNAAARVVSDTRKFDHGQTSTVGRRAFGVHSPMVWNSLPDDVRTQQDFGSFKQGLKTRLIRILHEDLHWLDVAHRDTYKLGVIMHRCQHGKAARYLVDCCTPATDVVGRRRLRSATQQQY